MWYEMVSVVQQNVFVFNASIRDNITMLSDFPREEVDRAIELSCLSELIAKRGEDYLCGENGGGLSGGEKQRVSIARSLLKKSQVLLVDEATAALDPIAEAEIYAKFNEISGDKTAIYISHRLPSCKFCDEIAVFHEGAVIQQGTHDTLLADGAGKYHELWNAQARDYKEKTA